MNELREVWEFLQKKTDLVQKKRGVSKYLSDFVLIPTPTGGSVDTWNWFQKEKNMQAFAQKCYFSYTSIWGAKILALL